MTTAPMNLDPKALEAAQKAVKATAMYNPTGDVSTLADPAITAYLTALGPADVQALGYVNVYRGEDGSLGLGSTDLDDNPNEPAYGSEWVELVARAAVIPLPAFLAQSSEIARLRLLVEEKDRALDNLIFLAEAEHICLVSWNGGGSMADYDGIMSAARAARTNGGSDA